MPERRVQIQPSVLVFPFCCAFLFSISSHADELRITPNVTLKETYNDNVYLTESGSKTSAFITEVMPGVIVVANGPSFKLDLNYAVQELDYSGQAHSNRTNQILSASSKEEFIKNLFYFENSAHISQQDYSAFAPQSPGNQTLSGNRYEVKTYDLEPYLKTNFGSTASGELRYVYDSVETSNGGLINSVADTLRARVNSGPAFKTVDWSLLYSDEKIHYKNQSEIQSNLEMENILLDSGYHVSSELALTGSVGYEKNNYVSQNGEKPEGNNWSLGFKWTPSERTTLAASVGRHYYGNTYSLIFNERTRATAWNLGYTDALMTSRGQFSIPASTNTYDFLNSLFLSRIPDPTLRQNAIDDYIQNFGLPGTLTTPVNTITEQVFLQKQLLGSVALLGLRNSLIFSVFAIHRDIQSVSLSVAPNNSNALNNTKQTGANIILNHNFTPRTTGAIMASRSKNISESSDISFNSTIFTTSLHHQWDPKLRSTLEFQHIQSESSVATASVKDNLLSVLVAYQF